MFSSFEKDVEQALCAVYFSWWGILYNGGKGTMHKALFKALFEGVEKACCFHADNTVEMDAV